MSPPPPTAAQVSALGDSLCRQPPAATAPHTIIRPLPLGKGSWGKTQAWPPALSGQSFKGEGRPRAETGGEGHLQDNDPGVVFGIVLLGFVGGLVELALSSPSEGELRGQWPVITVHTACL